MTQVELLRRNDYIIDTHAHYDNRQYDEDRDKVIEELEESDVGLVVNIGIRKESCEKSLELAHKYNFFYTTLSIQPMDVEKATDEDLKWIRDNCSDEKVVAIGETGLDYDWHKEEEQRALQRKWFKAQLLLAKEMDKPVVIHSRAALEDTMDILRAYDNPNRGIIHCYSYGLDTAKELIDMGYMLGVGGILTFKNAKTQQEVVENIPLENMVLETDAPFLSPTPLRGSRNTSLNLRYIVDKIAEIKNISPEKVVRTTNKNAKEIYKLI